MLIIFLLKFPFFGKWIDYLTFPLAVIDNKMSYIIFNHETDVFLFGSGGEDTFIT